MPHCEVLNVVVKCRALRVDARCASTLARAETQTHSNHINRQISLRPETRRNSQCRAPWQAGLSICLPSVPAKSQLVAMQQASAIATEVATHAKGHMIPASTRPLHAAKTRPVQVQAVQPHTGRRSLLGQAAALLLAPALLGAPQPAAARPLTVIDVDKAKPGERDVFLTTTGIKYAEVSKGSGTVTRSGDLVLVDMVGRLEDGQVFLDTRKLNQPMAFQIGTSNKYVPEGISELVEGMSSGSIRLAVLPPSLGYKDKTVSLPGATVPPNSKLFYEVELLRCETFTLGLACCSEAVFTGNKGSCIKKPAAAAASAAAP